MSIQRATPSSVERYLRMLQSGLPKSTEAIPLTWMDHLTREQQPVQAALRWLGEHGSAARGIGLAQALLRFWSARRHRLAVIAHRVQQEGSLRRGLAVALERDLRLTRMLCEESRAMVAQIGVRQRQALVLAQHACAAQQQQDYTQAAALFAKSLVLYQQLDDARGARFCLERLTAMQPHVSPYGSTSAVAPVVATPVPAAYSDVNGLSTQPRSLPQRESTTATRHQGSLSSREREVAALIARGLTNRQIAAALVIAERTASTHVVHILNKLGVHSRAQIAAWHVMAERHG
jgi:DNA-binding CsgD family transcriptional regulator